jgi:hypothetical protein
VGAKKLDDVGAVPRLVERIAVKPRVFKDRRLVEKAEDINPFSLNMQFTSPIVFLTGLILHNTQA